MMTSYFNLLKYAATGQASPSMTYYDRMRASTLMGGVVQTLTGIPPLSFKSDGTPLISWSMKGNGSQTGTPSPQSIIMPTFCGVRTANLIDESKVTPNAYISSIGATGSSSVSNISDFIDINGSPFAISGVRTIAIMSDNPRALCYFDSDKNYISGVPNGPDVMTRPVIFSNIPSNAKYVRFTFDKAFENGIMLNIGSTALPYEPFGWAEKITCAGQTTPVYLGQTQTVRRIRKLVLTGEENFAKYSQRDEDWLYYYALGSANRAEVTTAMCTHVLYQSYTSQDSNPYVRISDTKSSLLLNFGTAIGSNNVASFKAYLAQQYAAGTPVTVWYVLATPETGITNEPLCKIGTYADELNSTDAAVTIPTANGNNVLTIDTPIQPSKMTITFKG